MSSDPNDPNNPAAASPQPSPSPENPFSPKASTTPIATSSTTGAAPSTTTSSTDPPQTFVAAVNNALQFRLGPTKYGLIPAADKKALIAKIWADPNIQNYWTTNSGHLSDPNVAGTLGVQINSVMMGQGNDPTVAIDYTNMLQAAGVALTSTEQASLSGATQAVNAPVPRPFDATKVSGYDYGAPMPAGGWSSTNPGQSFGWSTHNGVDYGTPAGSRITSPFAGTVHVETGVAGYGNYVTVTLDNGWVMGFGHVQSGAATDGARVNPGDLIAISGANVGSAQGAVTIVTWQDPQGNYQNPHEVFDPIFAGTTFSTIGIPGAAGTGMPTVNKVLDAEYPSIKSDWTAMFGSPPSPEDVYNVLQHGTSPTQWTDFIRSQAGHIPGMTVGQIYDLRSVVDNVSMTALGHTGTDGIVAELNDQGMTSQAQVKLWYDEHSPNEIDKDTYGTIAKFVSQNNDGALNDKGVDPRNVKAIHDTYGSGHGPDKGPLP